MATVHNLFSIYLFVTNFAFLVLGESSIPVVVRTYQLQPLAGNNSLRNDNTSAFSFCVVFARCQRG